MDLRLLSIALICLILTACGESVASFTEPTSSRRSGSTDAHHTSYPLPFQGEQWRMTPTTQLSVTSSSPTATVSTSPTATVSASPIADIDPDTVHPIAATLPGTITFARDPDFWEQGGLFHLRSGIIEQVLTGNIGYKVSPDGNQVIALTDYQSPPQGDTYQWYNLQTGEHETFEVTLRDWERDLIPAPDGMHIAVNYYYLVT